MVSSKKKQKHSHLKKVLPQRNIIQKSAAVKYVHVHLLSSFAMFMLHF